MKIVALFVLVVAIAAAALYVARDSERDQVRERLGERKKQRMERAAKGAEVAAEIRLSDQETLRKIYVYADEVLFLPTTCFIYKHEQFKTAQFVCPSGGDAGLPNP